MGLLRQALQRDLPVLAVCRGHQLLNVALGGTLLQHIGGDGHRAEDGVSGWHSVRLAAAGVLAGVAVGAATPPALGGLLSRYLPFAPQLGLYPGPLLLAAAFGLLTAFAFALWPLARARGVPAAALFRDLAAPITAWPRLRDLVLLAGALAALAGLAVASAEQPIFAFWFVAGATGAFLAFLLTGAGVVALARRLPRPRRPALRMALANLHRPGAPTLPVVLSFGLGLSVLVAVVSVQGNLAAQIGERLPKRAPSFFFIDIQPDQAARFDRVAAGVPGVGGVEKVPMLRGRIVRVNGVEADKVTAKPEAAWALRGDRGLTYAAKVPKNADVIAGRWWPTDYHGPPLISLAAEIADGLGLKLGDTLTVNVLGRDVTAKIANLRKVHWSDLQINFVMIFAPGILEAAPHTFLATARAPRDRELALQAAVTDAFPNVTAIRVREALEAVNRILADIGLAVRATASVTLAAGVLVLAGAVAAEHRRRVFDAVVLKVLGATRRRILLTHLTEYLALGLVVTLLALAIGSAAAYVVVTQVMQADWVWLPGSAAATAALSLGLTLLLGFVGTWLALGQKPAPYLRNE